MNVKTNAASLTWQSCKASQAGGVLSPRKRGPLHVLAGEQENINMQALRLSGQNVVIKVLLLCDLGPLALSVP